MKEIIVLVDFTETAELALWQAIAIAKFGECKVVVCHIASSKNTDEISSQMEGYLNKISSAGLKGEVEYGFGDLYKESARITSEHKPTLVIVGTHGKKGIRQNLFGSNIYKLARHIKFPTLVINDNCEITEGGFKRIVLPVSPHPDFLAKVKQSGKLLSPDGTLVVFAIMKPGLELGQQIENNIQAAKTYCEERKINCEFVQEESHMYSVGFSRETLEIIKNQNADLICIMVEVSEAASAYGKMDKENLLLNEQGLAVLCVNN